MTARDASHSSDDRPAAEMDRPVGTARTATPSTGRRRSTPSRVHKKAAPEASPEIAGVVGDASTQGSRSGEDVRKRGWFWHWNSIVTQYAPLLGLKGVGLLNSYTVWTDRREESPHRGYAFPSQQSEADFYGEDRAELITINKILVALDLIEIRKEMVLRVDAQGRRWKVPHNLYRVKDHGDDATLTTKDVLRVVELADRDRAVYRYLRRVFSPRFSPIDHANVWHQILEEVRETPTWQHLAARAEKEERKASERTKAGHAARKSSSSAPADVAADLAIVGPPNAGAVGSDVSETTQGAFSLPRTGDNAASEATQRASIDTANNDSTAGTKRSGMRPSGTSVAPTNEGLRALKGVDVDSSNNGSAQNRPGTVDTANTGRESTVAPSNTTYHQSKTTTTEKGDDAKMTEMSPEFDRFSANHAPDSARDETLANQRFAEANDRQPTMAERRHLRQLADYASTIVESGMVAGISGWNLVESAIEEAVSSGSSFVAPKRIREILSRWMRDGVPAEYAPSVNPVTPGQRTDRQAVTIRARVGHNTGSSPDGTQRDGVQLPNGRSAQMVWSNVCREVAAVLGGSVAGDLVRGTAIVAYSAGDVTVLAASSEQASALAEQAPAIERALRGQLRRPVRMLVEIVVGADDDAERPGASVQSSRGASTAPTVTMGAIPVFTIERGGMTNRQLWAMALNDLRERGDIPTADIDAWLRDAALLAVDEDGDAMTLVVGVPHVLAMRRVEARFRAVLTTTLADLLAMSDLDCSLEVVLLRDWSARQSA